MMQQLSEKFNEWYRYAMEDSPYPCEYSFGELIEELEKQESKYLALKSYKERQTKIDSLNDKL